MQNAKIECEKAKQYRQGIENLSEYNRASFLINCGNKDRAKEYLRIAVKNKDVSRKWIRADPDWKTVWREDWFQELLNEYVFSWTKKPGSDDNRLKKFLRKKYNIDWVCTAGIAKSEDGKTICISKDDKNLSLTLNDEDSEVILKIDNIETDKFIAKKENGELKIYLNDKETEDNSGGTNNDMNTIISNAAIRKKLNIEDERNPLLFYKYDIEDPEVFANKLATSNDVLSNYMMQNYGRDLLQCLKEDTDQNLSIVLKSYLGIPSSYIDFWLLSVPNPNGFNLVDFVENMSGNFGQLVNDEQIETESRTNKLIKKLILISKKEDSYLPRINR